MHCNINNKAFTLLQVIFSLTIIIIITTGIAFNVSRNSNTNDYINTIETLIKTAHSTSILKNTNTRLLIFNDSKSSNHNRKLIIAYNDNNKWYITPPSITFPLDISISFNEASTMRYENTLWQYIEFSPTGQVDSSKIITLEMSKSTTTLTITPMGGVFIENDV